MELQFMTANTAAPPLSLAVHPALLLSFDEVIADRSGLVSAPERWRLLRLFRALGGGLAVFSDRSLAELDRALGLPDVPLIGCGGIETRMASDLAVARGNGVETLLSAPPFAGRPLLVFGLRGASDSLLGAVDARGGRCAAGKAARGHLSDWLERIAPTTADRRAYA